MPAVKEQLSLRIANLTAFLRFELGVVQGQQPQEAATDNEKRLRKRVSELQSALSNSERRLRDVSIPQHWIWTAYIVSDKHRFVFLANHKVATTSILISLLPLFDFDDVEVEDFADPKRGPTFKHNGVSLGDIHGLFNDRGAQINKAHFLAGLGNKYHRYFKFAFVRNPWDRLVSCYMSKLVQGGTGLKMGKYGDVSLRRGMSFKEFAEAVCHIPDEISNHHFRSQHVTICDDGPEKAILADFVGRFEKLDEDFRLVAERIGLETGLPHAGGSRSRNSSAYRDFYDERVARMVGNRYLEDATLFGYSF
jgi:hypothetical protein